MDPRLEQLKKAVTSLEEVQDDIRLITVVADAAMLNSKIEPALQILKRLESKLE